MAEETKRLHPTPSTVKKLFAHSGNKCAFPDCTTPLVHRDGTVLGKIAHIHAASPGGARFDKDMSDEDRRKYENLILLCGGHHDRVDNVENESIYPAAKLKQWKEYHEAWYIDAEQALVEEFSDNSTISIPTFPKNLGALADALDFPDIATDSEYLEEVVKFVKQLSKVPLPQKRFAVAIAERLNHTGQDVLLTSDVESAFSVTSYEVKNHFDILDNYGVGCINEGWERGQYEVDLRRGELNHWTDMLGFARRTGRRVEELYVHLNFALYQK